MGSFRPSAANSGRRYRLYPDPQQAARLESWAHTCRAIWNTALAQRVWAYQSPRHVRLTAVDQCAELTQARREYGWLADLPAQAGQQVLRHLDAAYDNWWDPRHQAQAPRFKRKGSRLAVSFPGQAVRVRRISRHCGLLSVPKLGRVRLRWSRSLGGVLRNATVTRDGLGWHVAFGVHADEPAEPPVNTGPAVGVDLGIACSVYLSTEDGERQRPTTLTKRELCRMNNLERRKARQLTFARKYNAGRYSNRLRRTMWQIAALRARQARRRKDWNHKLTTDLAQSHGLIAVEDLKVSGMQRSARGTIEQPGRGVRQKAGLNRAIADQGWFEIRRQLGYKTRRHGSILITVPASGTSQTCVACGMRDALSRQGCGRLFACVHCGHTDHADRNAARIILDRALATAGRAGPDVSGHDRAQCTRSSSEERGASTGSRMREPSCPQTVARRG